MRTLSFAEEAVRPLAGERAAPASRLARLYDEHAKAAYRLLLAILHSPADAQDALGEVFLKLARRDLDRLRNPRAYLLKAARHQAIALLRRRQRERRVSSAADCFFDTTALDPTEALLAAQAEEALRELPPGQREVVVLRVYEDLTFPEIARLTRCRRNTVASRYRYAMDKLRKKLKEDSP